MRDMTIQNMPIQLNPAERIAWLRLMGSQPIPATRAEIIRQASATFEIRCKQSPTNIETLSMLVEAAETLLVFGGPVDTKTTSFLVRRPTSLPATFRTVQATRLHGHEQRRPGVANEMWADGADADDRPPESL